MAVTRREVVLGGAAALALAGCAASPAPVAAEPAPTDDPARTFPQSVASGDPTPTGAIVWTRLAPEVLVAGRELVLEVASDDGFRNVVVTSWLGSSAGWPAGSARGSRACGTGRSVGGDRASRAAQADCPSVSRA